MHALRALYRRMLLLLACLVAGPALAALVLLQLTPVYTATALVLIEAQAQADDAEVTGGEPVTDAASIASQVEILGSSALAARVAAHLGLDASFAAGRAQPSGLLAPLADLSRLWAGDASAGAPADEVVLAVLAGLEVRRKGQSHVVAVRYRSSDPLEAARLANAVAEQYLVWRLVDRLEALRRAGAVLEERAAELRARLAEGEAELAAIARAAAAAQGRDLGLATELAALKGPRLDAALGARRADLEVELRAERALYEQYRARLAAIRDQEALQQADARMLAEAVPPSAPSFPQPAAMTDAALSGSLALGLLLVFLLERLDSSVRSARALENRLGLPVLALVPRLGRELPKGGRPSDYVVDKPLSLYAEAVRGLLTSLTLGAGKAGKVVLVTSGVPAEGKTTLALSLARLAALEGRKVCLVDGDLRHPSLGRALELEARAGLDAVLGARARLDEALTTDDRTGMRVLTASAGTPSPSQLLAPPRVKPLLDQLRRRFDLIVVDGAPVLAVTDSRLLARLVDRVVYVVRWGTTPMAVAEQGVRLVRDGAELAGSVLSQVDLRRHAAYDPDGHGYAYANHGSYYVN